MHHICQATHWQALEFIVSDKRRRRFHRKMLPPTALHPKPSHIQHCPLQWLITLNRQLENPPGLRGRHVHVQPPSQNLVQDMALLIRSALIAPRLNKTRQDRLHQPQPRQTTLIRRIDVVSPNARSQRMRMTSQRCVISKRGWNSASRTSRSSPCAPRILVKRPEREKLRKRRNLMHLL